MGLKSRISGLYDWAFQLFVLNFGWLYVLYVQLPIGFLRRQLRIRRDWLMLTLKLAQKGHGRKVANVQRQVRQWHKLGCPSQKMCTAGEENCQRMCFTRPAYKRALYQIRLDSLGDIIEINTSASTVRVEPQVTVDQLQRALLPLGFSLPVVPELGDLPIGGLIQGCGIGSGSARHGLFQHICVAFEMVTATGELVVAEKEGEHQSLFFGIPWSLGTLGFLVSATLQIQKCPPLVRLVYQPCLSAKELAGRMQEEVQPRAGNDFVEAIQFDKDRAILLSGKLVEQVPKNDQRAMNPVGRWHKPLFFEHAKWALEKGSTRTEYIPTAQYFQRHWRSLFWELGHFLPFASLFPFRWLLGWLLPLDRPFPKSTRLRRIHAQRHVLQNLLVPAKTLPDTLALLEEQLQIYPLWLCPFVLPAQPGLLRNRHGLKSVYVNVGIFGVPRKEIVGGEKGIAEKLEAMEDFARNVQGFQMLCADSHQTPAEFWEMFDATLYDWLRARYECKASLLNVYEKLCMANRA